MAKQNGKEKYEEEKGTMEKETTKTAMKEQEEEFSAHRMFYKTIFEKDMNMDFAFQWLMGYLVNGGCASGEMFYAASQIEEGNPESWIKTFAGLAQRVDSRAESSLKKGHKVSAREAFMRASNYYRIVTAFLSPYNPEFREFADKARSCFRKAAPLFDPPIEALDIPFEGKTLAGYFVRAGNDGKKRKTLLMIGGGETHAEDLYFYIGPHALKRGYNFATADLPGQGITPFDGMNFRPDTEVPMGTILDYVVSRPEVDADRVAAYGISGGGYYVPRAACYDKRIKACIANSLLSDLEEIFAASPVNIKNDKSALRMIEALAWRWGVKEGIELIEKNKEFKFDCSLLTNPLLIVVGEGEYQNKILQRQVQECMQLSKAPKKDVVMTPIDEGAGHHCQGENTALMAQVVFDWLDELFD